MNRQFQKWFIIIVVVIGGGLYIGSSYFNKNHAKSTFNQTQKDVTTWTSTSPQFVMSTDEAQTYIDNIKAIQKGGWKLLVQDEQPVSFNKNVSGRNDIIEQSALKLLQGCYEILIDSDGNIMDIKPSSEAKKQYEANQKLLQDRQAQQANQEQQDYHNQQVNIIQNNITDISRYMDNGYRFVMKNNQPDTLKTWNINNKDDNSPGLEFSIKRLLEYSIFVKSDKVGKVTGFDFSQTGYTNDKFNLYGMTN